MNRQLLPAWRSDLCSLNNLYLHFIRAFKASESVEIPRTISVLVELDDLYTNGEDVEIFFPNETIIAPFESSYVADASDGDNPAFSLGPLNVPFVVMAATGTSNTPNSAASMYCKIDDVGYLASGLTNGTGPGRLWIPGVRRDKHNPVTRVRR